MSSVPGTAWLLLLYKIAPEPTAGRVYIWRKLKRLGAILLHDAAWVLPDTPRTREHFQWLAAEIIERGGEALLWQSRLVLAGQDEALVRQFVDQAEAAYRPIQQGLERPDCDLAALSQQYQQAQQRDYFRSKLGRELQQKLLAAREDQAE